MTEPDWDQYVRERVQKIREVHAATTQISWITRHEIDGMHAGKRTVVASGNRRVVTVDQTRRHHTDKAEANVRFIADAHADVPWLLDVVERLSRELEELKGNA